ncbi:MAG TPA: ATP-binding protein [Thermoprotei archaeon]|nr:ATP-binding protein [Thermoprotei archaeon]
MFINYVNPWWTGRLEEDPDYSKWVRRKVKWIPRAVSTILNSIRESGVHLNFIVGPRQVGKTTGIKIAVSRLLNKIEARRIFYYRCDLVADYKELLEVIQSYLRLTEVWGIRGFKVVFLDEVNLVNDWWRAIKFLIDTGILKNINLFLTGSTSMKLLRETERFPGRRGFGVDIFFPPLSFEEYLQLANSRLYSEIEYTLSKTQTRDLYEALEACVFLEPYLHEVNRVFLEYLNCGGYPLSVLEYFGEERGATESFLSSIRYDIERAGRNIGVFKDIVTYLLQATTSPISLDKIAREAGVSKTTSQEYLQLASDLFLLNTLKHIDPYRLQPIPRKERKYYFTDPFIYKVFSQWCNTLVKREHIVEATAIAHLLRTLTLENTYKTAAYYWRNKTEVDLIIRTQEKAYGFEVTWSPLKKTALTVGRIKDIILLDREELNPNKRKVPLTLFLLTIGIKNLKLTSS